MQGMMSQMDPAQMKEMMDSCSKMMSGSGAKAPGAQQPR